jgi:hypothetical protein
MFIFQTRYRDMNFQGVGVRSQNFYIHTEDEKVAKELRGRKDVWEVTQVAEILAGEGKVETKPDATGVVAPKRPPGRPKGIRGSRTATDTQGE